MIVISLALVIAAAVSLFIGLFVVTDSLTFIFVAIALCLLSLLLLWLGTRTRRGSTPSSPSAPVYGGGARAGGSATPARAPDRDAEQDIDELTAPGGGGVVRKTTARDRAATRVAADGPDQRAVPVEEPTDLIGAVSGEGTQAQTTDTSEDALDVTPAEEREPSAAAKKATAKKATKKAAAKKATKKAIAKKSTKKASAKKATKKAAAKKATKKAAAKKSTKKASASGGTSGAAARSRLAGIAGVGPAKQDALLSHYGSLEAIRDASVDDIVANVKGFGEALAGRVKDELSS